MRRWELEAQSTVHAVFTADEIPALMPLFQRRIQLENQYWMNQVPLMPHGTFPTLPHYDGIIRDVQMRQWNMFKAIPARSPLEAQNIGLIAARSESAFVTIEASLKGAGVIDLTQVSRTPLTDDLAPVDRYALAGYRTANRR